MGSPLGLGTCRSYENYGFLLGPVLSIEAEELGSFFDFELAF